MTRVKAKKSKSVDVGALSETMLINERGQNEITLSMGLGSAGRALLEARNREIDRELTRRSKLDEEMLERERRARVYVDRFQHVPTGTMVTRSAWWHQQHAGWPAQYGVITGREIYEENGCLVTYPVVHWEGAMTSSSTHPDNATVANTVWKQTRG